jgi:hypothetical protein
MDRQDPLRFDDLAQAALLQLTMSHSLDNQNNPFRLGIPTFKR